MTAPLGGVLPPGTARLPDGPRVHPDIDCVQAPKEIVFRTELPKSPWARYCALSCEISIKLASSAYRASASSYLF